MHDQWRDDFEHAMESLSDAEKAGLIDSIARSMQQPNGRRLNSPERVFQRLAGLFVKRNNQVIKKLAIRIVGASFLVLLAGCGTGVGLVVVPDDCALFTRTEARNWFADAQAQRINGASELEAFGAVLLECVQSNCDGNSGGVCAVSCAACTDALVTLAYP
ncbi:MAG: hypothetical protein Q7R41_14505 [Phycisphaerales bacterium]|nr:hypothetical protein [Phycisphaerales bacterium]